MGADWIFSVSYLVKSRGFALPEWCKQNLLCSTFKGKKCIFHFFFNPLIGKLHIFRFVIVKILEEEKCPDSFKNKEGPSMGNTFSGWKSTQGNQKACD